LVLRQPYAFADNKDCNIAKGVSARARSALGLPSFDRVNPVSKRRAK
jgi:hypothetical protein